MATDHLTRYFPRYKYEHTSEGMPRFVQEGGVVYQRAERVSQTDKWIGVRFVASGFRSLKEAAKYQAIREQAAQVLSSQPGYLGRRWEPAEYEAAIAAEMAKLGWVAA